MGRVAGMWERSAKSLAQCRKKMQENKRELVGKDLLLGKRTVSFQAINKGTLWGHKEGRGAIKEEACPVKLCSIKKNREAGILKAVRAPRSSVVTDLQQGTDDVGTFGKR